VENLVCGHPGAWRLLAREAHDPGMRGACLLDIPFRTVMEREERPFLVDRTADAVRTLLAIGLTTLSANRIVLRHPARQQ
jgi:hypothetical protein